jgi:hypothetical protein
MDFEPTPEQREIIATARAFAQAEMMPFAAEWDERQHFPVDVMRRAAALGFAAIYVREEAGGSGLGRIESALILEELAAACPPTAAFLSIHNMIAGMIDRFADAGLKARILPRLVCMEWLASYCLTEPGSGSDAASLRTRAVREADHYVVNGTKSFISGSGASDLYLVMVRTGQDGPKGITSLLIEKGTPGLSFGRPERKLGWCSQPTAQVILENVRVPVANRLGEEGQGFTFAMQGLDGGRVNIAACSLGGARRSLELATAYAKERKQFGRPLAEQQALQFRLADMATSLEAARLMVHRAAAKLDRGDADASQAAAMAKRFATDTCSEIVNDALQLHGGYGYLKDYAIERYWRDLRVHQILEGTNEIMRLIIARRLLAEGP